MKIFKIRELKTQLNHCPLMMTKRLMGIIINATQRQKAEINRRQRMKLGEHLLLDLGFTSEGRPLPKPLKGIGQHVK